MYDYDKRTAKDHYQKDLAKIQTVKWNQVPPETLKKILLILKRDLVGF